MINKKISTICISKCGCSICGNDIKKSEVYLDIRKTAWKGMARSNICRECLIKMFMELGVKGKELKEVKAKMILNELESDGDKNDK